MRAKVPLLTAVGRGLRCRCPQCGQGRLYRGLYTEVERCPACGHAFDWYSGEVLGFLYMSTAVLTGLFVIVMLIWNAEDPWLGRAVIIPLALAAYVVTTPFRKGAALGLKIFIEQRTGA